MKVAIMGYGKMGKTIAELLEERGHQIHATFGRQGVESKKLAGAEVAIEFSRPESAFDNIRKAIEQQIPVIIGTTGWLQHYDEAVQLCEGAGSALLYASNFSLGVNLFFSLNQHLASLMAPHGAYAISIEEIHHTEKLDAPSGTAITLAEQIAEQHPKVAGWTLDKKHAPDQLPIVAKREAGVRGTHIVRYQSTIDDIEIKHQAHSRKGFALGAVLAAEFIQGKTGVFQMQDVLNYKQA